MHTDKELSENFAIIHRKLTDALEQSLRLHQILKDNPDRDKSFSTISQVFDIWESLLQNENILDENLKLFRKAFYQLESFMIILMTLQMNNIEKYRFAQKTLTTLLQQAAEEALHLNSSNKNNTNIQDLQNMNDIVDMANKIKNRHEN